VIFGENISPYILPFYFQFEVNLRYLPIMPKHKVFQQLWNVSIL